MSEKIITGIDIGTFQVKVVVVRVPKNKKERNLPQIIGTGYADSKGIRNGYIVNEKEATRSVRQAVSQAEKAAGVSIKKAHISVGGIGIEEIRSKGETVTSRADSVITQADIEKAQQDSEEHIQDSIPNRNVLHIIPLSYHVDNQLVLGKPEGMHGVKLETENLFITIYSQHLKDTIQVVEGAGIDVEDVMANPIAAGLVIVSGAQKRAGSVMANIGSETVSIVVYENNTLVSVKVFPIGSNDITNDIALGLKIPLEEAEKIKRGGMSSAPYTKKKLDEIIQARLVDIFELVDNHLKKLKRDGLLPAGVIITGGGSSIVGIQEVAKQTMSLPARVANLDTGQNVKVRSASWSVAYGLCTWASSDPEEDNVLGITKQKRNPVWRWFSQFLP